jgi:hypothetical protein
MDPSVTVELKGRNKAIIIGADYATTEVDDDFWSQWIAVNKEFPPVKSGAIFEAKNLSDATAKGKEFEDRLSGFEPMSTDGKDSRASGTKPVDKD